MFLRIKYLLIPGLILLALAARAQSGRSPYKEVYISEVPRPSAPAVLEVTSQVVFGEEVEANNILDAGETLQLRFRITNQGRGDAYKVNIELKAVTNRTGMEYPRQKLVGNLPAGRSTEVAVPLRATRATLTGRTELDVRITEGNGFDADPIRIAFNTQAFKTPEIAVADYRFGSEDGGFIKLGQVVSLSLLVQNKGQGTGRDIRVAFGLPANVYPVAEETFAFDKLAPNESRQVLFEFFTNKKYTARQIPVTVTISESYGLYGETRILKVAISQYLPKTQLVNVVADYADKVKIEQASITSDVDRDIPVVNQPENANRFALIIGNEDYATYQSGITSESNVNFALNDALVFREYCRKTLGVPERNITLLLNATAGKMLQAIDKLNKIIQVTGGRAEVLVYYAGHGLPDETTRKPYLIPVDVSGANLNAAIALSDLYGKLAEYPARQVTVFLDACFSGGARSSGLLAARGVRIKPKEDNLKGNMVVFAASAGEESSLAWNEKQHGMFTYFLLKKIKETRGNVTYDELYAYLKEKVPLESLLVNNKTQTPQVLISPELTDRWEDLRLR